MNPPRTTVPGGQAPEPGGFTLVELLAATTVLAIILVLLLSTLNQTSRIWRQSSSTIEAFQSAREAFDLMTRKISEATLNTFWDYEYSWINGEQVPTAYRRESDLHFVAGPELAGLSHAIFFQTPDGHTSDPGNYGGMNHLLNDFGFYLVHGTDDVWRPPPAAALVANPRYRLIQLNVPTEQLGPHQGADSAWFSQEILSTTPGYASRNVPIGVNIVAVVFHPKRAPLEEEARGALPGGFLYNSRTGTGLIPQPVTANQLPPLVEVVMIAIDERSATRLAAQFGAEEPAPVRNALTGRLQTPGALEEDLEDIGDDLSGAGIGHRIFRTTVPVHGSKWSES